MNNGGQKSTSSDGQLSVGAALKLTVKAFWEHKILVVSFFVLMAASIGYSLLNPWFYKLFLDNVLAGKPLHPLLAAALPESTRSGVGLLKTLAAVYLFYYATKTTLEILYQYAGKSIEFKIINSQRTRLFERLQFLPIGFHQQSNFGDSLYRFTQDVWGIPILWNMGVVNPVSNLITLGYILAVVLFMDKMILLLMIGALPLMALAARYFDPKLNEARVRSRRQDAEVAELVHQSFSNIKTVKVFARENFEIARFKNECLRLIRIWTNAFFLENIFKFLLGFIGAVSLAGIFYLGALKVMKGQLQPGDIIVLSQYLEKMFGPVQSLIRTKIDIQTGIIGASKVNAVMEETTEAMHSVEGDALKEVGQGVRFDNVSFGYNMSQAALRNVSFDANLGDMVALVGGSGQGKSTIINLILRLYDPTLGRILIDGSDFTKYSVQSVRDHMSVVMQEVPLLPGSIKQNILYSNPSATMRDVERAAAQANAHNFILKLPRQYDTEIGGEGGVQLSMGQRQRIAIARAFLRDTPILILDEPTSALDSKAESAIMESLDRLIKGRLVFVIAHRLSTIRNASKILVLKDGRIVEQGNHDSLIALQGEYASFYTAQHLTIGESN